MESQPQNPEFRIDLENFHSCDFVCVDALCPNQISFNYDLLNSAF